MKRSAVIAALLALCLVSFSSCALVETRRAEGKLESCADGVLTLRADDGSLSAFDLSDAVIDTDGGLIRGAAVTVRYRGILRSAEKGGAPAVSLSCGARPEPAIRAATVLSLTQDTVTLQFEAGEAATFSLIRTALELTGGLEPGAAVSATVLGEGGSCARLVRLQDTPPADTADGLSFSTTQTNDLLYAVDALSVRSGPDLTCRRLGGLAAGAAVRRTARTDNGWSRIIYGLTEAYVPSEFLSENSAAQAPISSSHTYREREGVLTSLRDGGFVLETESGTFELQLGGASLMLPNGLAAGMRVAVEYSEAPETGAPETLLTVRALKTEAGGAIGTLRGSLRWRSRNMLAVETAGGSTVYILLDGATALPEPELETGASIEIALRREAPRGNLYAADSVAFS